MYITYMHLIYRLPLSMDITASNHEIHELDLLLLLAMKMIKIIDCMGEKIKYIYILLL